MKKVMVVFGTRPDAVKMCPLIVELKKRPEIRTIVCSTGQHREMLDQVLDAFNIFPDYDLDIMKPGQTLFDVTIGVLEGMKKALFEVRPDVVLVHGDTTTAFAAALACYYLKIPVGHVEAGLRTHDVYAPYPEEFNRQALSITAKYHFAPTQEARENLLREGRDERSIFVTGNTVVDALRTTIKNEYTHPELQWAQGSRLILFTAHRREVQGEVMQGMFRAVRRAAEEYPDVKIIYPVHRNPQVRETAKKELSGMERIHLVEPMGITDFHNIMARSSLILTDSGGVQEEAASLGKPVVVMREKTERLEGVKAGVLRLAGTGEESVYREMKRLLTDQSAYQQMAGANSPYGDGYASVRIADILIRELYGE